MPDFEDYSKQISDVFSKIQQVSRVFIGIWNERIVIYSRIIDELGNGKGLFRLKRPDIKTYAKDFQRLYTLHSREKEILKSIVFHMDETLNVKERLINEFLKLKPSNIETNIIIEQGKKAQAVIDAVKNYFENLSNKQLEFLLEEEVLISEMNEINLKKVYCKMKNFMAELERSLEHYESIISNENLISEMNESVNSLEKTANDLANSHADTKIKNVAIELRNYIKQYKNKEMARIIGNRKERWTYLYTHTPEIITAMFLRSFVLGKLLFIPFSLATTNALANAIDPQFQANNPIIYQTILNFQITILCFYTDVGCAMAQTIVEKSKVLFAKFGPQPRFKYALDLSC